MSKLTLRVSRELSQRRHYGSTRSWLLSLYNRALRRYPALPLPRRGATTAMRLKNLDRPLFVRLGTTDTLVVTEVFQGDEYGPLITAAPKNVQTVLDLGANIGVTVRLWQQVWPQVRVAAIEPDPENLSLCRTNIDQGPAPDRVCLIQACAAGSSRRVHLDRTADAWTVHMSDSASGPQVAALSVPELLGQAQMNETVDVLKCDIEGAEAEVFANCAGWIQRVRYMVVELHENYGEEQFLADLSGAGATFDVFCRESKGVGISVLFLRNTLLS